MDEAEIEPLDRWGWECPNCHDWHEEEEDPNYQESIFCPGCGREFKPIVKG